MRAESLWKSVEWILLGLVDRCNISSRMHKLQLRHAGRVRRIYRPHCFANYLQCAAVYIYTGDSVNICCTMSSMGKLRFISAHRSLCWLSSPSSSAPRITSKATPAKPRRWWVVPSSGEALPTTAHGCSSRIRQACLDASVLLLAKRFRSRIARSQEAARYVRVVIGGKAIERRHPLRTACCARC